MGPFKISWSVRHEHDEFRWQPLKWIVYPLGWLRNFLSTISAIWISGCWNSILQMSQVADVSSTSLLGCKQASDRDTGRSRCAQRAAQDLRAAQVERHPLGAACQIGKMLHQPFVPMKFSMVYRFNQPPVWNFLCQQHCLLDQFVFRCNWRYSGATCGWWFSVKVLTPLYYLFPFQVGILPSNQPWVPRRCRCAKWNVIQLTDPDRTWKGISIAIPMCVCVCYDQVMPKMLGYISR